MFPVRQLYCLHLTQNAHVVMLVMSNANSLSILPFLFIGRSEPLTSLVLLSK